MVTIRWCCIELVIQQMETTEYINRTDTPLLYVYLNKAYLGVVINEKSFYNKIV